MAKRAPRGVSSIKKPYLRAGMSIALSFILPRSIGWAQTSLTLDQAVQEALSRYPAVQTSLEQAAAASAAINLARTSYLPRADLIGQSNRATHNNVFGMLL